MATSTRLPANIPKALLWIIVSAACYLAAQYIVGFGVRGLIAVGVVWEVNSPTSLLVYRLVIYALTVALIAGAVLYRCRKVGLKDFALTRLPYWRDIGLAIVGAVVYTLATTIALTAASKWLSVDLGEAQNLGFSSLGSGELLIAFIVLVVLTPLFEEALFRGFLYGRLRQVKLPWWVPAVVVSALFGLAHGQWNVGIDVFVLSIVACALREITGSIWAGVLLHMLKNMVAFLLTFVFITGISG